MSRHTARLLRRGLALEWITIGWNAVEVFITIGLGVASGSLALVAFGLDSVVEIFASLVVVWQLRGDQADSLRMRRAVRLVGLAFLLLGIILVVFAAVRFASRLQPDEAPLGIAYLALTVVVMCGLAWLKDGVGRELGNHTLRAEARVTYLDGALAAGILAALVANAVAGWWWADPLAAAVVGALALAEARENLVRTD